MALDLLLIAGGYLLGSISTAIIVCRLMELPDPRSQGSNNPGATNVLRIGGKRAAAWTLAGDFAKGIVPVALAKLLGLSAVGIAAVGFAAFLGHLFPIFFQFRGGKGVATAAGGLVGFSWQVGLAAILTWLLAAKVLRISSAAGLLATIATPLYLWWFDTSPAISAAGTMMCIFVLWRHKENIRRLMSGTESGIGR